MVRSPGYLIHPNHYPWERDASGRSSRTKSVAMFLSSETHVFRLFIGILLRATVEVYVKNKDPGLCSTTEWAVPATLQGVSLHTAETCVTHWWELLWIWDSSDEQRMHLEATLLPIWLFPMWLLLRHLIQIKMPFLNTLLLLQLRICTCVGRRQHLIQTVPHVKTNTFEIQKYFFKKQYKALLLTPESRRSEGTFAIRPANVTAVYNSLIGRVYTQKSMGLCRGNPAFFIWCQGQLCPWLHLGQDFITCVSRDSLWFCQQ